MLLSGAARGLGLSPPPARKIMRERIKEKRKESERKSEGGVRMGRATSSAKMNVSAL